MRDYRRCPECGGWQRRIEGLGGDNRVTLVTLGWTCTDCRRLDNPDDQTS